MIDLKPGVILTAQAERQIAMLDADTERVALTLLGKVSPRGALKFGKPIGASGMGLTLRLKRGNVRMIVAVPEEADLVTVLGIGLRS